MIRDAFKLNQNFCDYNHSRFIDTFESFCMTATLDL